MPTGTVRSLPDRRPRIVRRMFGAPVGSPTDMNLRVSGFARRSIHPTSRLRRSSRRDAKDAFMRRARTQPPRCDGVDRPATMSHSTDPIRVPVMTTWHWTAR